MVTTSDEGIWTVDTEMVLTFVNERLASLAGYSVDEMVGRRADEFIAAAAREPTREVFAKQREEGRNGATSHSGERTHSHLGQHRGEPDFRCRRTLRRVLGMATDVTAQRALERNVAGPTSCSARSSGRTRPPSESARTEASSR
jgi:PAS domain S-box-containing protein